jgi:hypothetical protein
MQTAPTDPAAEVRDVATSVIDAADAFFTGAENRALVELAVRALLQFSTSVAAEKVTSVHYERPRCLSIRRQDEVATVTGVEAAGHSQPAQLLEQRASLLKKKKPKKNRRKSERNIEEFQQGIGSFAECATIRAHAVSIAPTPTRSENNLQLQV